MDIELNMNHDLIIIIFSLIGVAIIQIGRLLQLIILSYSNYGNETKLGLLVYSLNEENVVIAINPTSMLDYANNCCQSNEQ